MDCHETLTSDVSDPQFLQLWSSIRLVKLASFRAETVSSIFMHVSEIEMGLDRE